MGTRSKEKTQKLIFKGHFLLIEIVLDKLFKMQQKQLLPPQLVEIQFLRLHSELLNQTLL